ncbi:MAG: UDP-3-O-(3-hydroxymyristoyl)glucosamine N-acyltransferase [Saprospiraceae bacterium]
MEITVRAIAQLVNGVIVGDPELKINRPSRIEEGGEGSISFFGNSKYESFVYTTDASALLVAKDFEPKAPVQSTLIKVEDVYAAIALLLESFGEQEQINEGIADHAAIDSTAVLGTGLSVGAFTSVGADSVIGDNCVIHTQVFIGKKVKIGQSVTLFPGVKIMDDCEIGDHCVIHANVVIGSDGFGFAPQPDGSFKKIPQLGNVIVEERVEIGANTTIDRGSIGSTIIRKGAKLDNLIQVAHNVEIGENTVIAAQTGIAGSTRIGKNCMIGGQVGFAGHIQIADGTQIQAQSGIMSTVKKPGTALFGYPAFGYRDYLKSYALFRRLPQISDRIRRLEAMLKEQSNKKA